MIVDLILMDISDFDVILSIDFLSKYRVKIDCRKKMIQFSLDNDEEFIFGEWIISIMISSVQVRKMLSKWCKGYLVHIVSKLDEIVLGVRDTAMVQKFSNVFPDSLLRLALKREVESIIELALGTILFSKALYGMVPTEL